MAFAPDGRLFVCLQSGQVRVIDEDGVLLANPFVTLSVDSIGERGLLGVAFDPNFATNRYVYVYYTVLGSPAHNRISRFRANGNVAAANSEFVLVVLNNLSNATNYNGGAIHFGPDGKLLAGVGDNANGANAQSINNRLGKILRINSNGTFSRIIPDRFRESRLDFRRGTARFGRSVCANAGSRFNREPPACLSTMLVRARGEEISDGVVESNYR